MGELLSQVETASGQASVTCLTLFKPLLPFINTTTFPDSPSSQRNHDGFRFAELLRAVPP